MHDRHASVIRRSGEAGGVGDDATTDGHDAVGAGEAPLREPPAQRLDRGERLGRLAVADEEGAMLDPGIDLDVESGLGDDGGSLDAGGEHAGELMAHTVAHEHVVGTIRQRHGDDDHARTPPRARTPVQIASTTSGTGADASTTRSATSS